MISNKFKRLLAVAFISCIIFFSFPKLCSSHSDVHDGEPLTHDHHHHHDHDHEINEPHFKYSREANVKQTKPKSTVVDANLWLEALGSTVLISIAPFLILFFVPISNNKEHESLLKILLSFASGGLLGDAFLHLIPHALMPHSHGHDDHHAHDHSHEHAHSNVGLWVLTGILLFLIVEKFVRITKGSAHSHSHVIENDTKSKETHCVSDEKECFLRCEDCPENQDIEVEPNLKKFKPEKEEKLIEEPAAVEGIFVVNKYIY